MDTYAQPDTTKRQYRPLEEKQRIVGEALAEGASVDRVHSPREMRPLPNKCWSKSARRALRANCGPPGRGRTLLPITAS
jgi:hypothetical protein